jgi:hypothetical protein
MANVNATGRSLTSHLRLLLHFIPEDKESYDGQSIRDDKRTFWGSGGSRGGFYMESTIKMASVIVTGRSLISFGMTSALFGVVAEAGAVCTGMNDYNGICNCDREIPHFIRDDKCTFWGSSGSMGGLNRNERL